jgi:hypothetical protein
MVRFAVNDAFLPVVNCSLPDGFEQPLCPVRCRRPCAHDRRIHVAMALYEREAIFGVFENKLLSKLVLRALGVPHTGWRYGALLPINDDRHAAAIHPHVPWYQRTDLIAAIAAEPDHRFVLKPLTDGGARAVTVMDRTRWERLGRRRAIAGNHSAVAEHLVAHIEKKALCRADSPWSQEFEHRGVLLEERYGSAADNGSTYELKVFVVFGEAVGIVLYPGDDPSRILARLVRDAGQGGRFRCLPNVDEAASARDPSACAMASLWINKARNRGRIDEWALRIAQLYGADWYRLDVFAGDEQRGWLVNEITYPSHVEPPPDVWRRYAESYGQRGAGWTSVPADVVLRRVSEASGVPVSFMLTRRDSGRTIAKPWGSDPCARR